MHNEEDIVDIITDLSSSHWDGIAQLFADEEWIQKTKEMVEVCRNLSFSKAIVAVNRQGRVIGLLTWTEYLDSPVHYVSSYLVSKGYCGRGIGLRMWDEMMKRVAPGRILAVDANPEMASKYRSRDFPYQSKYGSHRLSFTAASALSACKRMTSYVVIMPFNPPERLSLIELLEQQTACTLLATNVCSQVQIVPLSEELTERVAIYDQEISGRNREPFLREYFATVCVTTRVAIKQDRVVGYSCRVPMMDGIMRLAPLFADSFEIAVALLGQICDFSGRVYAVKPLRDDCPFLQFLQQHTDCSVTSGAGRSFSQQCTDEDKVDRSRVFALTCHSCQSDC